MQLSILLKSIKHQLFANYSVDEVNHLTADSRQINPNTLFFAIKGSQADGHKFIPNAIEKGAVAIVCEQYLPEWGEQYPHVLFIQVADTAKAMGLIASHFYDNPSKSMKVVGVTGTNGKTTVSSLLYKLFTSLGYYCGLISTVEYIIGHKSYVSTHTTPDALRLQSLLGQMRDEGCEYVFMEVSSHAAHQQRIAGLHFAGAIFTNLSHDHLDYHGTFQNYIQAKKLFFDNLPKTAFALVNLDDKRGEVMLQNCKAAHYRYSLQTLCEFKAKLIANNIFGLQLELDDTEFYSPLIGDFNAYNLLAVYAAARLLKADKNEVLTHLSKLQPVAGRFDLVRNADNTVLGIVDYAHTPDALEKVLRTIHKIAQQSDIITIVGCGGDRDKTKRPIMAKIAYDYSGCLILTSDNPRTEKPEDILADMEKGLFAMDKSRYLIISDRAEAIKKACELAHKDTVILLAGKGHETYQEINGLRHDFDDKKILTAFLN